MNLDGIRILPDYQKPTEEGGDDDSGLDVTALASREYKHTFSPSQISTYLECHRKWGFRRLDRLKAIAHPSAQLGSEGHSQLEAYQLTGKQIDFTLPSGNIIAAGLHYVPPPMTKGLIVERLFRFQSPRTDFVYLGKKDLEVPPGIELIPLMISGTNPGVVDWKTTSSIDKYAKDEDALRFDPQQTIYAFDSMARYETPRVDMRWLYFQTKGAKKAELRKYQATSAEAVKVFAAIEQIAMPMARAIDDKKKALDLIANPKACDMYGGCPYKSTCNLAPNDRLQRFNKMGLIDTLKARVQGNEPTINEQAAEVKAEAVAINPPESALPPAPLELEAEGTAEDETEAPAATDAPAPKKRGRPKKVETIEALATQTSLIAPETKATSSGFTVYINCLPIVGGELVQLADDVIAAAKKEIKAKLNIDDYRMLDFGKGAGILCAAFEAQIDAAIASGVMPSIAVDTRTPEGALVAQTLAAKSSRVIRGF